MYPAKGSPSRAYANIISSTGMVRILRVGVCIVVIVTWYKLSIWSHDLLVYLLLLRLLYHLLLRFEIIIIVCHNLFKRVCHPNSCR